MNLEGILHSKRQKSYLYQGRRNVFEGTGTFWKIFSKSTKKYQYLNFFSLDHSKITGTRPGSPTHSGAPGVLYISGKNTGTQQHWFTYVVDPIANGLALILNST